MKNHFAFLLIVLIAVSCEKTVPVNLTDFDQPKLVVEGCFTNSIEIQKFRITWTANLGAPAVEPVDGIALSIQTPDGLVNFISVGQGNYESEIAFAGIPGEWYTIQFTYQGSSHSATTQMPYEISIDNFSLFDSGGIYGGNPSIILDLNSVQTQYYRYDLFRLNKEKLPDTSWTNMKVPVYETYAAQEGSHLYLLNLTTATYNYFDSTDAVRIIVYSISEDVHAYLKKMKDFMNYEPKGGRYENPPYYFSNSAYGLGYGSVTDTAYFSF